MTAVFVLRHPQTTWNAEERYQGRLDAPPSAKGKQQAQRASAVFCRGDVDAVYTSPMARARYLARLVSGSSGAPITVDERLTEIGQSPWEGLHVSEIRVRYADLLREWHHRPDLVRFPRGESLQDVRVRTLSALDDIMARYPDGSVALVTHSVVIQVLVAEALSLELRHLHRVRVDNAGITTIYGKEAPGSLLSLNATTMEVGGPLRAAAEGGCAPPKRRIASL